MKGIFFDCDGVLCDTEVLFAKGSADHLRALGIEPEPADNNADAGISMWAYCERMVSKYRLKQSVEYFYHEEQRWIQPYFQDERLKPMPRLIPFLKSAEILGFQMAVVSSSSEKYVRHLLELFGISDYFSWIISGDHVRFSKPDPEIYELAIQRSGLNKNELFVIEDSPSGIRAAHLAGLKVIGYKGSILVQDTSSADLEVSSFDQIDLARIKKEAGLYR